MLITVKNIYDFHLNNVVIIISFYQILKISDPENGQKICV